MADHEEYQDYDEHYYDERYGESPRSNRAWLIVAIVVVVVLLCCCCMALVAGLVFLNEDILAELESIAGVVSALEGMRAFV